MVQTAKTRSATTTASSRKKVQTAKKRFATSSPEEGTNCKTYLNSKVVWAQLCRESRPPPRLGK